jgi:hypothetical protein
MLAARLSGSSSYDNPRPGRTQRMPGVALYPRVPCPEGRDVDPFLAARGPVHN